MGILDILTGGSSSRANSALEEAKRAFANIPVPTKADLSLPQLQQYVEAGIMTPEQAKAYLTQGNAYNDINLDPASMEAEMKALNELSGVASAGGMTPQMKAQLTASLDQVQTQERGDKAAIGDQFAQRGIPSSLMAEAAMREEAGNASRNANLNATQAAGQAEQNAINAMMNEGNLAGQIHGQVSGEAERRANAENAMRQWNAGAQNTAAQANADRAQQATGYNAVNKQNVANQNTGVANQRTEYNAQVPETVFQNQITKAGGQAGVSGQQAKLATDQGNQIMGLIGAGVGAAGNALAPKPDYNFFDEGGPVPGHPNAPGDSPQNDTVHAMLSPGEVVIPRSIAHDPEAVKRFVQHLAYGGKVKNPVAPEDVHLVLEALSQRRAS